MWDLDHDIATELLHKKAVTPNKMGQTGINISFSLMKNYTECPRQAFLSLTTPPNVMDNKADVIGPNTVHKVFANWVHKASFAAGWMQEHVQAAFVKEEQKASFLSYRPSVSDDVQRKWGVSTHRDFQLAKATESVKALEILASMLRWQDHQIDVERWITVKIPGDHPFYLKGALDIWDAQQQTIYDIKVTLDKNYLSELQLSFYALLHYYQTNQMPTQAAFILPLLSNPILTPLRITPSHLKHSTVQVTRTIKAIQGLDFPVNPVSSNTCFRCNFKNLCPKFGGNHGMKVKEGEIWAIRRKPAL